MKKMTGNINGEKLKAFPKIRKEAWMPIFTTFSIEYRKSWPELLVKRKKQKTFKSEIEK